jgi:hypothetical protein
MSSYPFLDIARKYGADYGDVLSYADWLGVDPMLTFMASPIACANIWQTRALVNLPAPCRKDIRQLCMIPIERRHLDGVV